VLDGFQQRERTDAPSALERTGKGCGAASEPPGERRTGTVMKTVPVAAFARIVLG
jgi:hypothetical protein